MSHGYLTLDQSFTIFKQNFDIEEAASFVKTGNSYPFPEEVSGVSLKDLTMGRTPGTFVTKEVCVLTSEKVTSYTPDKTIGKILGATTDKQIEALAKIVGKELPCVFLTKNEYYVKK